METQEKSIDDSTTIHDLVFECSLNPTQVKWVVCLFEEYFGIEEGFFMALSSKNIAQIAEERRISPDIVQLLLEKIRETKQGIF